MASAAAALPPSPPPAPIVPNDGTYAMSEATSGDTSASTFTCCPLVADLTIPSYVSGAGSFTGTLSGTASDCRTSALETAPTTNDMTIDMPVPFTLTSGNKCTRPR